MPAATLVHPWTSPTSLRTQTGITQEQLAAEIDLTIESVSNIERGIHGPNLKIWILFIFWPIARKGV